MQAYHVQDRCHLQHVTDCTCTFLDAKQLDTLTAFSGCAREYLRIASASRLTMQARKCETANATHSSSVL